MRLIQRIKKDSTVLEFGPSTGRLTSFMVSELQCTVYGVEIDEDAFSVCKKYLKKGLCGDIEDYAWQEKFSGVTFDYVIFADVLEHLHDPKRVIQEVKPFLKEESDSHTAFHNQYPSRPSQNPSDHILFLSEVLPLSAFPGQ